ncbi:MAG: imidazolonepropionase [Thermoanaerobaculia bacterium]
MKDAAVRAEDGRLVFVGSESDYARQFAGRSADVVLDARGRAVVPGLVDAHTHPVWLGDRAAEIARRLAGESYATIAAEGGGINATVRATRAGSGEQLASAVRKRLETMLAHGTTTAEAKSGYGLTERDEIRALELLRTLSAEPSLPRLVPTLLAAHEVPPEFAGDRAEWVRIVAEKIVPRVAQEKLAAFCDVFCEKGVFTVEESRTILAAARRAGLGLRVHADELARSGGAMLAAELSAASADHLLFIEAEEIAALARAGTVAVVLPGTAWWMRSRRAPARALVEAGVPVAVASDANPGTCCTESLAAVAAHACLDSGLTVEETLTGMTLNAAASLGLAAEVGSLEAGKAADLLVLDAPDDRHLIYHWGINLVDAVVLRGRVVKGRT